MSWASGPIAGLTGKVLAPPFEVITPYGAAAITLEIYEEDGRLIGAIRGCDTVIPTRGRLLRGVRSAMPVIEDLARKAGVTELRIGGRDWSRALPEYEALAGVPNGLRKVL